MQTKEPLDTIHLASFHQKLRGFVSSLIEEGMTFASTLTKTSFGYLFSFRRADATLFSFKDISLARAEFDAVISVTLGNSGKEINTSLVQEGEEYLYQVSISPLKNGN